MPRQRAALVQQLLASLEEGTEVEDTLSQGVSDESLRTKLERDKILRHVVQPWSKTEHLIDQSFTLGLR